LPKWVPHVASHGCVKASIDNSDGAYKSLYLLGKASGVGVEVTREIVFDGEALRVASAEELAGEGGEDYNLFLAVPEGCLDDFLSDCRRVGGSCWVVGRASPGSGVYVGGRRVGVGGWSWF